MRARNRSVSLQAIVRAHCVHEGVDCTIELEECEVLYT